MLVFALQCSGHNRFRKHVSSSTNSGPPTT
jgi:hypothetical protein